MTQERSTLAVIPARAGSKRVPDKNVRDFRGKPLLTWPVQTALACDFIDTVVVSTDDDGIAAIAETAGALVPFLRPRHLADDFTPTVPVIAHAIQAMSDLGHSFDEVYCIYPAAVTISVADLRAARQLLHGAQGAPYVATVVPYHYPIQRALERDASGQFHMVHPENSLVRSQDLPERWHDAGQFYVGPARSWLEGRDLLDGVVGLELESWRFHDIDTLDDWQRAELAAVLAEQLADPARRSGE